MEPCDNCGGPNDVKQADPFLCPKCQAMPFLVSYADKTVRPTGIRVSTLLEVETKSKERAVGCVYEIRIKDGKEQARRMA